MSTGDDLLSAGGGFLLLDIFFMKIAVFWLGIQAVRWCYMSHGWNFPDVLRDRRVALAYLGIVLP